LKTPKKYTTVDSASWVLYSDSRDAIFGELYSIASNDRNVIILSADTGMMMFKDFKKSMPEQIYNVGIAEQNTISVAAGLSLVGKKVFVFAIADFITLRCFEQIKIDICSMNLPVVIIGMGTGYMYSEDGPTHHMIDDISLMRALPGMTIWNVSDYTMAAAATHLAYENKEPSYLRFDRGFTPKYTYETNFNDGLYVLKKGTSRPQVIIISTGVMVDQALKVSAELDELGISNGVIDLYRLKPLNEELFLNSIADAICIVTIEEHTIFGGIGSIVCETMAKHDILKPIKIIGIPDVLRSEIGDRETMRSFDKIDTKSIVARIKEWIT